MLFGLLRKMLDWFIIRPDQRLRGPRFIESTYVPEEVELSKDELLTYMLKVKDVSEPEIVNPTGKKTLLILNDLHQAEKSLNLDLEDMKLNGYSPYEDYKIVRCNGKFANLSAYKYLLDHQVDVAILDVMTNTNLLMDKEHFLEFNGLDVAEEIKKKNEDAKVAILTTLPMTTNEGIGHIFGDKFKKLMDKHVITKYISFLAEDRVKELEGILYK